MRQIIMNLGSSDSYLFYGEHLRQGEHLAAELVVNLNEEFQGYRYLLVFQLNENEAVYTEELFPIENRLIYPIPKELLTEPGMLKVELQAFEEITPDNIKIIKSAITKLKVAESLEGVVEIMPEPYIPWYTLAAEASTTATEQANIATQKAEEVENIRDSIVTEEEARQIAEADRVSNEQNRIEAENERIIEENIRKSNEVLRQTNENTRNNNENERVLAENERIANEEARQTNEQNRETAETARDTAEAIRANNEAARIAAENNRNTAEQVRIEAENTREANEATRQSNEAARQAAESDRATAEEERMSAEQNRIDAESKRADNEDIRQSNESARQVAETVRVSAEDDRVQAEQDRATAENVRNENETIRQTNESVRVVAENIRSENEATRQTNELNRVAAEQARVQAEQDRITAENQRIENENIRQDNENARIEAEQAREERMAEVENNVKQHELKILKVEKEINDYRDAIRQINVNQEPKQKVSGYGIVSLPKNAANGQFSEVVMKGLTATNLIKNGDFRNDTEWFSGGSCEIKITDGDLELYKANGNIPNAKSTSCYGKAGDKIYITAIAKPSSETTYVGIRYRDNNADITTEIDYFTIDNDTEVFLSDVITLPSDSYSGGPQVIFRHSDIPTESCFIKSKSMMAINLTETFGAGNEPTVEECDEIFANWFDGTKSTVSAMRLKSVSADETETFTAYVVAKDEEGKIAELRSLPNGVKDEIMVMERKVVKKVKKKVLETSDVLGVRTTYSNLDYVKIKKPSDFIGFNSTGVLYSYAYTIGSYQNKFSTDYDDFANIGITLSNASPKEFWIGITKGTYNINDFIGTTLTYQLTEPEIIENVQVSGTLLSYPSGTIYIENATADAGIYGEEGITVLHEDLPIKELETLSKIDFVTGLETKLDISKAVINQDKLSFTHPDLEAGDIVFFTYFYDREGTQGEFVGEYYDSRYVVKDSVTDKFYKWSITVTNGTPSIQLTEV